MNTREHILTRYPRLIRAMCWAAILSRNEAVSAIQCHQNGDKWSGEAVNHFGGNVAVIRAGRYMNWGLPEFPALHGDTLTIDTMVH